MEFNIPINKESLLENSGSYYVHNVCGISSMEHELDIAKSAFQSDGPEYILEKFDTYYSVIYHGEKVSIHIVSKTIDDLGKPINQLNAYLEAILTEQDIEPDVQTKSLNILKMLVYAFTNILGIYENKVDAKHKEMLLTKTRKAPQKRKHDEQEYKLEDKLKQLSLLMNMLQVPIFKLWEPPICEEQFINSIAETCFSFLQNPTIKQQKETWQTVFHIFGVLLKNYGYSLTFTIRLIQVIKASEHLELIVPSGIRLLVEEYNCRSIVREMVRELTEWQTDEAFQDAAGTKQCSNTLIELTAIMPQLMLPEVVYLLKYLNHNSYTLRNCILSVTTEVVIKVLCKEGMSDAHKHIRNQLLIKLQAHLLDVNGHVRSKTLQNWARLHTESAIPLEMQLDVLNKATVRLRDKGTLVRKSALQLITTFLKCNPYASTLDLDIYEKELEQEMDKYRKLKPEGSSIMEAINRKGTEWSEIEEHVWAAIREHIDTDSPEEELQVEPDTQITDIESKIVEHLKAARFREAFLVTKIFGNRKEEIREKLLDLDQEEQIQLYFTYLFTLFNNVNKHAAAFMDMALNKEANLTAEQMDELHACEDSIKFLADVVKFLQIMDSIVLYVKDMLMSATISDVLEAIDFFVTAHQFQMKNTSQGLAAMLVLMNSTEQDRDKAVIEAYKKVFLSYEGNAKDRPKVIVTRLIGLLRTINLNDVSHLATIVSQWTAHGDIDNAVIELLWDMFTGKGDVSSDDTVAALHLLSMAALKRRTIVQRNINLISELVFGEQGVADPRLVIIASGMLGITGDSEVDMTEEPSTCRVRLDDSLWENLVQVLLKIFRKRDAYCHSVLSAAIEFVYKICRKPDILCTKLIKSFVQLIKEPSSNILVNSKIDPYHLACFVHLLGEVAVHQFCFLDVTVYKELKRRKNVREEKKRERKAQQKQQRQSVMNNTGASASLQMSKLANRMDDLDESTLDGASADDSEAEFILNICENEIVTANLLGPFTPLLVRILKYNNNYADKALQASTVLALVRFMTVSSRLCEDNLQLLMTVLEKSQFPSVKNNIIIGMADLLHRFPNVIEPWSSHLYKTVKDEDDTVRMTAVTVITQLIMEDMLRVKSTISDIALCIVDECNDVARKTEAFFHALSQKNNVIYNILPDVVSRLSNDNSQIDGDVFRKIMTFLISLIDKDKQIECLVEKMCLRFKITEKPRVWRDIAFCLTLLNHTEKSLIKMEENFAEYKTRLEDDEVYDLLLSIVIKYRSAHKDEVKNVALRVEQLVRTGENTQDEAAVNRPRRRPSKASQKTKKTRK